MICRAGGRPQSDRKALKGVCIFSYVPLPTVQLNSDVDVVESLRNLSRPLSLNGDEDRLVSEIARPVLAYAKR